ncbi:hypothetical protein OOK58_27740 [Streptomyces sp. NBC_01728]|uniref:hypothetical protein n=1 Tax=unclassified Streptomyces TaxID=2593676 RepID=UPI0022501AB4|nr:MULTISPECIES: hypothetical protein [unclassified Streptomyces]MCX4455769.1 hypothetical protein [Streptomyces sp. NBC_01719]MCX4495129.1 hypothetical protein [Streptomyces sp. NBC_01728]
MTIGVPHQQRRTVTQSRIPLRLTEPYPFVGSPLESESLGYLMIEPRKGGDVPLFGFMGEGGPGVVEVRFDGIAVVRTGSLPPPTYVSMVDPLPRKIPGLTFGSPLAPLPATSPVFHTARALAARQAAVIGNQGAVESFASDVLGLWRGARWQEPVSTALLGDWASSIGSSGTLHTSALDRLRAEVKEIHRQLTPVWRRRVDGERLLSLDFALGEGLTMYDIVTSGPDPYETLTGALPADPRIAAVLDQLAPAERAVAMAWAAPEVRGWTEAASIVIDLDPALFTDSVPAALGERVRRKLKRLGDRYTARAAEGVVRRWGRV